MRTKLYTLLFCLSLTIAASAQEQLDSKDAVAIALEHNFGIIMAKNNVEIAKNNAHINNSGFLPQIAANAGTTWSQNNSKFTFQDGSIDATNKANSTGYNASINLNYTLFDGLGRSYNFKKLKESEQISELEAQAIIENALLNIFAMYYEVARLTENQNTIKESLEISTERYKRASYGFNFGQMTKLQVLNAEVDVNSDSIQYYNSKQQLANAKRDLNLLLGRSITTSFQVNTLVDFKLNFKLDELLNQAKEHNTTMKLAEKDIVLSEYDLKITKAGLIPRLSFNSAYSASGADNDNTFNYAKQQFDGLSAGLALSWNIFDGGSTKTRIQNNQIKRENMQVLKNQFENELERDVSNALEIYNNSLFVLQAEVKNVETNERNFLRTEEQYKLGQVTSIEFRQAQINLLNARWNYNSAKYQAKLAELKLLKLSGDLLNTEF